MCQYKFVLKTCSKGRITHLTLHCQGITVITGAIAPFPYENFLIKI